MSPARTLAISMLALAVAGCAPVGHSRFASKEDALVYVNERYDRQCFGMTTRRVLQMGHYAYLDQMADTLVHGDYRFPSGVPKIHAFFYFGFEEVDDPKDPALWEKLLSHARDWVEANPSSMYARIGLIRALHGRAWFARGGGYAGTVSSDGWRRFNSDIEEASAILWQCPPEAREVANWYETAMSLLHDQGSDQDSLYYEIFNEGRAKFPDDYRLYAHVAYHLMPRWYGEPGDWENFATWCADSLPDSIGSEYYARIVEDQSTYVHNVFRESTGLSWERTKRGLEAWHTHRPGSIQPRSALAKLAWEAGHAEEAAQAFAQLGDSCEVEIWRDPKLFLEARAWALRSGKPGAI